MKLYPATLFGRLLTALLLVILTTGAVIAWLVMREREEVVFWGGESADLVDFLASTTDEIASLPVEQRYARVAELRRTPITFSQENPRRPLRAPRYDIAAAARSYQKQLQRKLGRDYRVEVRPAVQQRNDAIRIGGRRFASDVQLPGPRPPDRIRQLDVVIGLPGGGLVEYRVPAPRLGGPLPRGIFVQLGLLTTALAIVLFLVTRGVTRPLSALASSAEAMSRGEVPPPLPESGARELQEATRAFNTMNERLQRYMNSRNALLAAISHDLRTPLTRLRLRAEKVSDPELRSRFQHDVDEMNELLQSALDIFRGMRDDEETAPVDVMSMLGKICVEFAETGKAVALVGSAAAPVEARPNALKRCITNLVSNAINYGDRAAIHVSDGADLVIRVTDEGPGIPDKLLESVFEPFYRLDDSRNPATGGTGLGLSIARDIAQAHGGNLVLRNRQAGGLEAILTLPRD